MTSPPAGSAAEIVAAYNSGASLATVAEKFGSTPYKVKTILKGQNVALRSNHAPPMVATAEMVEQYKKGKSIREIGRDNNLGYSTTRTALLLAEVKLRSPIDGQRTRTSGVVTVSAEPLDELEAG